MNIFFKKSFRLLLIIFIVAGVSVALNYLAAAVWVGPTADPPGGNVDPPIFNESGDPSVAYTSLPFGTGGNIVSGGTICDTYGNCLDSVAGGGADNLGDHTATQNIELNNNWLSNDGGNEGISIDNDGNAIVSGNLNLQGGNVYTNAIYSAAGGASDIWIGDADDSVKIQGQLCVAGDCISSWADVGGAGGGTGNLPTCAEGQVLVTQSDLSWDCGTVSAVYQ